MDGEPAVAVNVPDKLVVIPTFAFTRNKLEPSPLNDVAVTIPVTSIPDSPVVTAEPTVV